MYIKVHVAGKKKSTKYIGMLEAFTRVRVKFTHTEVGTRYDNIYSVGRIKNTLSLHMTMYEYMNKVWKNISVCIHLHTLLWSSILYLYQLPPMFYS